MSRISGTHRDSSFRVMLPTCATLCELAPFGSVREALARRGDGIRRQIRADDSTGQLRLVVDTADGPIAKDRSLATIAPRPV